MQIFEKPPLEEQRCIAILATLPIPVHIHYDNDKRLYCWESHSFGEGTALIFEDALAQAFACIENSLLSREPQSSTSLPEEPLNPGTTPTSSPSNGDSQKGEEQNPDTTEGTQKGKLILFFKKENKGVPPDARFIRTTLAFASFISAIYSCVIVSLVLQSWWILILGVIAATILSGLTAAFSEKDTWAGDQTIMKVWAGLVFIPLGGYIGWLLAFALSHAISPELPSVAMIVGNVLGMFIGAAINLFGYVLTVAMLTGKQFGGKER